MTFDVIGGGDGLEETVRQNYRIVLLIGFDGPQNCEFVAPQSRDGVSFADTCLQSLRDGLEQGVARGMAEGIVDGLEFVEIKHKHGKTGAFAACSVDRVCCSFEENRAVGELGQRIVAGEVANLLLGALALGHVVCRSHAGAAALIDERASFDGNVDDATVCGEVPMCSPSRPK